MDLSGFTQLKGHGTGLDSWLEATEKKFDYFTSRLWRVGEMKSRMPYRYKKSSKVQ
jgi:hypothetical protein